jgi:hypothetical protein
VEATECLYRDAFLEFQRKFLTEAIKTARGNMCEAARSIGLHRNTVDRMMRSLGMRIADFKPEHPHHDEAVSGSQRKKRVAAVECPDCGSGRYRSSQMAATRPGERLVRCQGCYTLYSITSAESRAA